MIKKLLVAVVAIAMSMGTALAVDVVGSSVAGATTPPPTNYNCAVSGTVTFQSPGLSAGGALTANSVVNTKAAVTPTGSGCSGAPIKVTIPSATTPCPQTGGVPNSGDPAACLASKTKNGVTTYAIALKPNYYGTTASFATSGLSDLQAALQAKPIKTTIDSIAVVLAYGAAAQVLPGGVCGSNVGFHLTGNVLSGTTPISTYTFNVCLSGDTGTGTSGNFFTDLGSSTATIQTATVGGASSLTVALPNVSCTSSGTVTFQSPGLSAGGALTANSTVSTKSATTQAGTGCSGATMKVTIPSATTPCPQTGGVPNSGDPSACLASKTKNGVTTYAIALKPNYYGTTGSFATSGLSDLQAALQAKPLKTTVNSIAVALAYGTAAQVLPGGVCGSNVGFHLTGNVLYGTTPVGTYTDDVCLSGDTGTGTSGNFLTDLGSSTATIQTAIIGGASSLTATFNP